MKKQLLMPEPLSLAEQMHVHDLHRWLHAVGCTDQPRWSAFDLCKCGAAKESHLPRCRSCWLRWRKQLDAA